jgi:hypothetical protein
LVCVYNRRGATSLFTEREGSIYTFFPCFTCTMHSMRQADGERQIRWRFWEEGGGMGISQLSKEVHKLFTRSHLVTQPAGAPGLLDRGGRLKEGRKGGSALEQGALLGTRRDPNPAQSQSHLLAASPKETFIGERGHRATGEHFALRARHGAWDLLNPSRRRCELSHLKKTPLRIV